MAPTIKGGRVKSLSALRKSVKKSSGGGGITRVPKDAPLTVRFSEEPDRWYEFREHFDNAANRGFICVEDDCPGCADDIRASKRFLANAINVDENKAIAVALPTSLANMLLKRLDRFHTLMDRDYELSREGSGLDTEYDAQSPDGKAKFDFGRFETLDLGKILADQVASDSGDDDSDDDDDDPPWDEKPTTRSSTRPGGVRRRSKPEPDEDEEDDEPPARPRRTIAKSTGSAGKSLGGKSISKSLPAKKALPSKTAGKVLRRPR